MVPRTPNGAHCDGTPRNDRPGQPKPRPTPTGPDRVETAIAVGEECLRAAGFETTYCLVAPDERATARIAEALTAATGRAEH